MFTHPSVLDTPHEVKTYKLRCCWCGKWFSVPQTDVDGLNKILRMPPGPVPFASTKCGNPKGCKRGIILPLPGKYDPPDQTTRQAAVQSYTLGKRIRH